MRRSICALSAVGLLAFTSCSGDDGGSSPSSGDGFSVHDGLEQLPASLLDDGYVITAGDLDRATELAGERRPSASTDDGNEVAQWSIEISGFKAVGGDKPIVGALLPEAANPTRIAQIGEMRNEVGWTALDVAGFIEFALPPTRFTVMTGGFEASAIDDALGERDDDVWSIGGEDFSTDLAGSSAARPLGEALRLAEQDDRFAVSKSTPPIEDWLAGDDTLADDDDISPVAAALDDHDVYSAMIVDGGSMSIGGVSMTPDQIEALDDTALQPFDVLGVGLTVDDDDQAIAVFVYQHANDDVAEENADRLKDLFADGSSLRNEAPLSDFFENPDIEVDGSTVVVTAQVGAEAFPSSVWQMVLTQDILATHL